MRELLKKVGSLALAVGALSLVLVNAAVNHGCGGARSVEPATPAAPERAEASRTAEPPSTEAMPSPSATSSAPTPAVTASAAAPDPDCERPSYMYASKAAVWVPPDKCRDKAAGAEATAEPAVPGGAPLPTQQHAP